MPPEPSLVKAERCTAGLDGPGMLSFNAVLPPWLARAAVSPPGNPAFSAVSLLAPVDGCCWDVWGFEPGGFGYSDPGGCAY